MNEVNIRCMTAADVDSVFIIENRSFSLPWSRKSFETEIADNDLAHYLVAQVADNVVAYAGMWLILDESHVTNVAVLPDYRGQGVGKLIMASLILYAGQHGAKRMTLEVRASNEIAKNLYGQFGFTAAGLRKHYYTDSNEDAIIMWLDIKKATFVAEG
jgi:ribosomal-protein-alanine N-acetyltransferase